MPRWLPGLVALVLLLALPSRSQAQAKTVEDAVRKGGVYLKERWSGMNPGAGNTHKVGGAALAGLAMLEAGVPATDPAVLNVAKYVRDQALAQTDTYHVSLTILFLDKLGQASDVPVIQVLGLRLYAGMTSDGGWDYTCWDAVPANELIRLKTVLQSNQLVGRPGGEKPEPPKPDAPRDPFRNPGPAKAPEPAPVASGKLHAEASRMAVIVAQAIRNRGRNGAGGDHSNTQFGLIGLWVAGRHGVPIADALPMIEARYVRCQNRKDGGWGYRNDETEQSTASMTCAGLLGLAPGAAARQLVAEEKKPVAPAGTETHPFFNPQKTEGTAPPAGKPAERPAGVRERAIDAGLKAIGRVLASTKKGAGVGAADIGNFTGIGNIYYLLWSVERVGVAYGLDTIGEVDWFQWGCDFLLPSQQDDGSWDGTSYGTEVNTAFALLFLTKANAFRDLTSRVKGKVKDPGKAELRGGGAAPPLFAPAPKEGDPAPPSGGSKSEPAPKPTTGGTAPPTATIDPPGGGFTLPPVVPATTTSDAEAIAKALSSATDEAWPKKLNEARDSKGTQWTRGLMLAAARLDGTRRTEAREALADRLTRMTPATLRSMLKDPEPELRRAACLACAMRDERTFLPDLIERITDPSELVVRAARAGLKSLSGADFGPPNGADEEAKIRAATAWRGWLRMQPSEK